MELIEDIIRS